MVTTSGSNKTSAINSSSDGQTPHIRFAARERSVPGVSPADTATDTDTKTNTGTKTKTNTNTGTKTNTGTTAGAGLVSDLSEVKIAIRGLNVRYGEKQALRNVSLDVRPNTIVGIIGPANAGKTTLLKSINRTLDFVDSAQIEGIVAVNGQDVNRMRNVLPLRRSVGMVFPLPVGLPMSIYDNVAYAPRMRGMRNGDELEALVEKCIRQSALWDEVKDRLDMLGTKLSGGQQQRLTLARALSLQPDVLCLDEFSIAIDPVTTMKIEDVLLKLKEEMTIVLVTNLVQQAHRLADQTAFFNKGELIEIGDTETIFNKPQYELTYEYVTGGFG